ncbi:unnamed protein product [Schistosoma turkestanicum]|nr:unnamed protein product [Schistosoma turkestanicum]
MIPGIIDLIFLRLVIPFVLFVVTVVRYNGFSFVYLLFLLACPLLARPKCPKSTTKVQVYLILLITLSCVFTLSHPTLHIVLTVAPPYENALRTCQDASIAAQIGVQRLEGMLPYRAMRLVLPDIFILSVAVASLVYFSRRRRVPSTLLSSNNALSAAENSVVSHNTDDLEHNKPSPLEAAVLTKTLSVMKNKHVDQNYFNFTKSWNESQKKLWRAWAMDSLRMLTTVLLVCFAGITSPSLLSGVYLLSFLAICTYWACRNEVSPIPFASLRIFLLVYSGLHVCLYYLYQFPFFQAFCTDGSFLARLLGLHYIMRTSCEKPGEIIFPSTFRVVDCLAPPITMLLYYVLVLEVRRWLDSHPHVSSQPMDNADTVPTISESVSSGKLLNPAVTFTDSCSSTKLTTTVSAPFNDCGNKDMTLKDQSNVNIDNSELHLNQNLIQEHNLSKQSTSIGQEKNHLSPGISQNKEDLLTDCQNHVPKSSSVFPHQVNALHLQSENNPNEGFLSPPVEPHFDALFGLTPPFATYMYGWSGNNLTTERPFLLSLHYSAIKNSYILTLIAMMAWAVVYRSWLSFILLLSACILWIVPKSRAACLYSSPLIVLYAIVLILIQYIYGLNLNSDELPQAVTPDGFQLSELGMQRSDHCVGSLALQTVHNATVDWGSIYRIPCIFGGTGPRNDTMILNNRTVVEKEHNITEDSIVECIVQNSLGTVHDFAYLSVRPDSKAWGIKHGVSDRYSYCQSYSTILPKSSVCYSFIENIANEYKEPYLISRSRLYSNEISDEAIRNLFTSWDELLSSSSSSPVHLSHVFNDSQFHNYSSDAFESLNTSVRKSRDIVNTISLSSSSSNNNTAAWRCINLAKHLTCAISYPRCELTDLDRKSTSVIEYPVCLKHCLAVTGLFCFSSLNMLNNSALDRLLDIIPQNESSMTSNLMKTGWSELINVPEAKNQSLPLSFFDSEVDGTSNPFYICSSYNSYIMSVEPSTKSVCTRLPIENKNPTNFNEESKKTPVEENSSACLINHFVEKHFSTV